MPIRPFAAAMTVLLLAAGTSAHAEAQGPIAGEWNITTTFADGSMSSSMKLDMEGDRVTGSSGPLDENAIFSLDLEGRTRGSAIELKAGFSGVEVGRLELHSQGERLVGEGVLYGTRVKVTAERPAADHRAPRLHVFTPSAYHTQYSGRHEPVLRLVPGDRVRTTTLDSEGRDQALQWRGMPGNTLTGPFYVEGAMPGDTLVVRLDKVSLSRDTARMYSATLDRKAVQPVPQTPTPGWGRTWLLDRQKGVARLEAPGDRLGGLELPLKPMVGSIGVAPPLNQAIFAGDLGFHGGNLDYNRLTAGVTLYLPVYQRGALLSLGDGHALQGDGEISGQGLETSLEVEFTVDVIRGKSLGFIWAEDDTDVMVSGIDNTLDSSLQMATTGMSRWLKEKYALADSEIAALLSSSIEYDIAEVVDPRPHVVARVAKKTLAMIKARP